MGFRAMDDDEIAEFLAQPLVAVLAVDDPGWSPHVTPVWFRHLPDDNRFQVMTPAKSKKTRLHRTGTGELSSRSRRSTGRPLGMSTCRASRGSSRSMRTC